MRNLIIIVLVTFSNLLYSQPDQAKIMHISFDDAIGIFQNITDSADVYTSIFDNPFLSELKRLHDSCEAKFSMYCFIKAGDWKLENTTTKFADEFTENSNWLKFSLHQGLTTENFANADRETAIADYTYFLTNMKNIVGNDSASIDLTPRLHNFAGNEASCLAFKDFGVKGFLGADDNRDSYYLTGNKTKALVAGDKHYDCKNNLYIFKSETRLEKISDINGFLENFKKASMKEQAKNLIIFTHEYVCYDYSTNTIDSLTLKKLEACCEFAKENNYRIDYPQFFLNDSFCIDGYSDISNEVIKNPDFELDTYKNDDGFNVPKDWMFDGSLIKATTLLQGGVAVKGLFAYSIEGDVGSSFDLYQDIDLVAPAKYIIKASIKADTSATALVYVKKGDVVLSDSVSEFNDKWKALTVPSITIYSDTTIRIGISSSFSILIDDVQVLKSNDVITENRGVSNDLKFGYFPNPVTSVLYLKFPENFENGRLKIFNVNGILAKDMKINKGNYEIEVSELNNGMYVLNITNGYSTWSSKFVVNRN